jgi:hypothetical protein
MWHTGGKQESTNPSRRWTEIGEPLLGLGLRLNNSPWRLGPAWAVLAGALASQAPLWGGEGLLRLGGSLLLADALWGVLWRMPLARQGTHAGSQQRPGLPYAHAESPMVQLVSGLRWESAADTETGWQGVVAGLGLVAVLSVLLGSAAMLLSFLALIVAVTVRLSVRAGREPAMMVALLSTGFPWVLGGALGGTGGLLSFVQLQDAGLVLGVAFTVLAWAVFKVGSSASGGLVWPIWIAQCGVMAVLIALGETYGTALAAGCFVVPCLWMSRWTRHVQGAGAAVRNSSVWWLASMLAAAIAVRY